MSSPKNLAWLLIATPLLLQLSVASFDPIDRFRHVRQRQEIQQPVLEDAPTGTAGIADCNSTSCYRFYNSQTEPYFVESWPEVPFETGEFYAGSVPIDESDPSRTLFFVFKPAQGKAPEHPDVKEVTIWLNGGPGCTSLFGFFVCTPWSGIITSIITM